MRAAPPSGAGQAQPPSEGRGGPAARPPAPAGPHRAALPVPSPPRGPPVPRPPSPHSAAEAPTHRGAAGRSARTSGGRDSPADLCGSRRLGSAGPARRLPARGPGAAGGGGGRAEPPPPRPSAQRGARPSPPGEGRAVRERFRGGAGLAWRGPACWAARASPTP